MSGRAFALLALFVVDLNSCTYYFDAYRAIIDIASICYIYLSPYSCYVAAKRSVDEVPKLSQVVIGHCPGCSTLVPSFILAFVSAGLLG